MNNKSNKDPKKKLGRGLFALYGDLPSIGKLYGKKQQDEEVEEVDLEDLESDAGDEEPESKPENKQPKSAINLKRQVVEEEEEEEADDEEVGLDDGNQDDEANLEDIDLESDAGDEEPEYKPENKQPKSAINLKRQVVEEEEDVNFEDEDESELTVDNNILYQSPKSPAKSSPKVAPKPADAPNSAGLVLKIPINLIRTNPEQPRKTFSEQEINELAQSINQNGLLQPITVMEVDDNGETVFEIIAGERRFRACYALGLQEVDCIVKNDLDLDERKVFELALIENIQRKDLTPVEEAFAYQKLLETYGYTHEQIATRLGKSRSHITNLMRTLSLPQEVLVMLHDDLISLGHAKLLIGLENAVQLAQRVISDSLSVRALEGLINKKANQSKSQQPDEDDNEWSDEDDFQQDQDTNLPAAEISDSQDDSYSEFLNLKTPQEDYNPEELKRVSDIIRNRGIKIDFKQDIGRHSGRVIISYENAQELTKILKFMASYKNN